jgi:hypothetical protein
MKLLFIKSTIHGKNLNFILNCKKIDVHMINHVNEIHNYNLNEYDAVYSPCDTLEVDISQYPNTRFLFGPHFSVFPNEKNLNLIKGKNSVYIQPSEWAKESWYSYNNTTNDLKIIPFAFGVDTEKFNVITNSNEKTKVFVYYKHRSPNELHEIQNALNQKSIEYKIFHYGHYNEQEYKSYLHECKYAIWVGAHESQGFALEEALSCNVPLFVWNVSSMNQEYRSSYDNYYATTIPYWDERCGEYFYNMNEFDDKFNLFLSKLNTYKPREYVVENLSIEVREKALIELIESI